LTTLPERLKALAHRPPPKDSLAEERTRKIEWEDY
jgi:hypothetical protein